MFIGNENTEEGREKATRVSCMPVCTYDSELCSETFFESQNQTEFVIKCCTIYLSRICSIQNAIFLFWQKI